MLKYTPQFFQLKEFWCPCCKRGLVAVQLVYMLEEIRRAWGGPVRVNSAWRCKEHNKDVGGSGSSRHLIGCAADLSPVYNVDLLADFKLLVKNLTSMRLDWEIISYPWGMHVGVPRGEAAYVWDGGDICVMMK